MMSQRKSLPSTGLAKNGTLGKKCTVGKRKNEIYLFTVGCNCVC